MQTTHNTRNDPRADPAATVSFAAAGSKESTVTGKSDTDVALPPNVAQPTLPKQIGRFVVRRCLGEGGFGAVLLAHDPVLDREVAIKLPRVGGSSTNQEARRMLDEARTAARLKHPHVVTIHEVGESEEHGGYIAMEYVEGESLAQRLKRGRLDVTEAVRICDQIADAMQHAHSLQLVHRDLKPGNVMLDRDGNVKVCDFGLAMTDDATQARRGEVSGTWPYMSPEQIRGDIHLLDGRSDLWSLGVILYECLSGRRPFRGNNLAEIHEDIQTRDPKPLRQFDNAIPAALDDLFRRCTRREMSQRLRTAGDFRQTLAGINLAARQISLPRRSAGIRWLAIAAVVVLLIGVGAATSTWSHWLRPSFSVAPLGDFRTGGVDLLAEAPRAIVFAPSDEQSHYAYMPTTRRFTVDSGVRTLFSCGHYSGSAEYDVAAIQQGNRGALGVFWGLHPGPTEDGSAAYRCSAVIVEPDLNGGERAFVRLYRMHLDSSYMGSFHVKHLEDAGNLWIDVDWSAPMAVRVVVVDGRAVKIFVQEQPVILRVEDQRNHLDYRDGECGLTAMGGSLTFVRALRQPLMKEH
jgi:hypothetical protein